VPAEPRLPRQGPPGQTGRVDLPARLRRIVGPAHVLTDPALTASYETDWTGRWRGRADLVVRPADTAQVADCVAACADAGVPVVPQGGNTGLVGGGVPVDGGVVVSLTRLSRLDPVDPVAGQVTVGAGATVAAVAAHARAAGYDLGVDLASRDSATVGGVVATNAGGERVLRHGTARAQVVGLEAVLADGRVVGRLTGLVKDNVGYDLAHLLVGSEGTLGVVTRARLRLVPHRPVRAVALAAVADTAAAQELLAALRDRLDTLEAAELFHADGLDLVCGAAGLPRPFPEPHPTYVLVECATGHGAQPPAEALAAALAAGPGVRDAVLAADARGRAGLWAYRERHTEAVNTLGVPLKLDVAVPPAALPEAEHAVRDAVATHAPRARLVLFGHLAEANLHVNVVGADDAADEVSDAVLRVVAAHGGSISAEHGVGRAKVRWVHLSRPAGEVAAMRAVKRALDPLGVLNPGVLLPPEG
jgi:FAD/FMN-containing dehydrogenase